MRLLRAIIAMLRPRPKCYGPVHFADQGIQVCTKCHGCICCDLKHIDHRDAEMECFTDDDGMCHLIAHADRDCQKEQSVERCPGCGSTRGQVHDISCDMEVPW